MSSSTFHLLIFNLMFSSSYAGFCPEETTVKKKVFVEKAGGRGHYKTIEVTIPPPQCPVGQDVTTDRTCKRLAACSYEELAHHHEQIKALLPTYYEQLLLQNPNSAEQLLNKLSGSVSKADGKGAYLQLDSELSFLTLDEYLKTIFPGDRKSKRFNGLPLEPPSIPTPIATRIPFYQERSKKVVNGILAQSPSLFVNFHSIAPRQGSSHRLGYPAEAAATDERIRCTTGGFFSRARQSPLIYPQREVKFDLNHSSLLECKTPSQVSLYLDGKKITFNCNPGGEHPSNVVRALQGRHMCDPLFYGFFPIQVDSTKSKGLPGCHHPRSDQLGRYGSYSENIAGRKGLELLDSMSRKKSMEAGMRCPSCLADQPLESRCDKIARRDISPKVTVPKQLNQFEGAIVLSAKLALENPELWKRKTDRYQKYCGNMKDSIEIENCNSIGSRIDRIKNAMEILNNLPPIPHNEEIPMVGTPQIESSG